MIAYALTIQPWAIAMIGSWAAAARAKQEAAKWAKRSWDLLSVVLILVAVAGMVHPGLVVIGG